MQTGVNSSEAIVYTAFLLQKPLFQLDHHHLYIHTERHTHVHTHTHWSTCMHMYPPTHTNRCTHIYTHKQMYTHIHTQTDVHTYTQTDVYLHTSTYLYMPTAPHPYSSHTPPMFTDTSHMYHNCNSTAQAGRCSKNLHKHTIVQTIFLPQSTVQCRTQSTVVLMWKVVHYRNDRCIVDLLVSCSWSSFPAPT